MSNRMKMSVGDIMKEDCECSDPGCPVHTKSEDCKRKATQQLFRIDMEDQTGTLMCEDCASDAYESGLFA